MKIAVIASHIGSGGLKPSGQHGGGELHTFAFLSILNRYYDVLAVTPTGFYPAFDQAGDYGIDLTGLNWRPMGHDMAWLRQFDVLIAMDHGRLYPPIATRNILAVFFPQYQDWDVSGWDTVIANSAYTAKWIKRFWAKDADVVYPPVAIPELIEAGKGYHKKKKIVTVGRFFEVPGGNNKQHLTLVNAFKRLMLPDWELVMIGAQQNPAYVNRVKEAIGDDRRITIASDLSRAEYAQQLAEASFLWAATGYQGEDDERELLPPSSAEHWGIAPVEAAALRTPSIVHNSGGTPEGPALTWETIDELVGTTRRLIDDREAWSEEADFAYEAAWQFSMKKQGEKLLALIERPIVVSPHEVKAKIFISQPARSDITVGMVSDGPEITTGFANLTRMISNGLGDLGYDIKILAYQDPHLGPSKGADRFKTWRAWPGVSPLELLPRFLEDEGPTVLYVNYDIGNIRAILEGLVSAKSSLPVVAYVPIEGAPVIPQMIETLRMIQMFNGEPILYTRWGQRAVLNAGGPMLDWAHHGLDHAPFRPPPNAATARALREAVGWQDKFVVLASGRNKRTKNLIKILDAAAILKQQGHNDIRFYIHTNVNENIPNSSGPLDEAAKIRGLEGYVYFPVDLQAQIYGVPYDEPRHLHVPETNDTVMLQRYTLSAMTFIERMWLAAGDSGCFANVSMAEGFGLIPLEAMRCGVRVLSVNDNGPQREVMQDAPLYIEPTHSEYWHTCAMLPQVSAEDVAQGILALKGETPQDGSLEERIARGFEVANGYVWQNVVDKIDKAILRRVSL